MLIGFTTALSGCEAIQRATNRDHMTSSDLAKRAAQEAASRAEVLRQREERRQAALEFKRRLHPGLTIKEVTIALGEPDRVEFTPKNLIHWYDDREEPMFLIYDRAGVLEGKTVDTTTINARIARAQAIDTQRQLNRIQTGQVNQVIQNQLDTLTLQNQLYQIQTQQQMRMMNSTGH